MKLLDFIEKVIYKGKDADALDPKSAKFVNKNEDKLKNSAKELKGLTDDIVAYGVALQKARAAAAGAKSLEEQQNELDRAEDIQKALNYLNTKADVLGEKLKKNIIKFGTGMNLLPEQISNIQKHIVENSDSLENTASNSANAFKAVSAAAKNGFSTVLSDTKSFFADFGTIGLLMGEAMEQMEELNKQVVDFNRKMSNSLTANQLGYDHYGNSIGRGNSLGTIAGTNGVSTEQFLDAFKGLDRGNVMGNTNDFDKSQGDMERFGINAAQLSKFYGVEMSTVNSITANLVYQFGAKINDLNEIMDHGRMVALAAGISVKGYFDNLKQASEQVGKHYIAGGIQGMEKLALYASKTNQTVEQMYVEMGKFRNVTDVWEKGNIEMAYGMQNTAKDAMKIWALNKLGKTPEADEVYKSDIVKDLDDQKGMDKDGTVNSLGTNILQNLGMDPKTIENIQSWAKTSIDLKNSGLNMEEYLHADEQSLEIRRRINDYDEDKMTVGDKLLVMWNKIKENIIDPIASVMGPILDIVVDTLGPIVSFVADVFGWLLSPMKDFGAVLKEVAGEVKYFMYRLRHWGSITNTDDQIADKMQKEKNEEQAERLVGNNPDKGISAVGSIVGGAETAGLGYLGYRAISGGKGGILKGIKNLIGKFGGGTGAAEEATIAGESAGTIGDAVGGGGSLLRGLLSSGAGVGAGIGLAGNLLGGAVGGKGGETISTISSWAGGGAMLGSIFGPLGTAVGAGIGGIVGLVKDSWGDIDKVWEDGSTGLWASLTHHSEEAGNGIVGWVNKNLNEGKKENAEFLLNKYGIKQTDKNIQEVLDKNLDATDSDVLNKMKMDQFFQNIDSNTKALKDNTDALKPDSVNFQNVPLSSYKDTWKSVNDMLVQRNARAADPYAAERAYEQRRQAQDGGNVTVNVDNKGLFPNKSTLKAKMTKFG